MTAYVEAIDEVTNNSAAKPFRTGELEQVAEGECSLGTAEELGFFEENVQLLVDRFIHIYDENLRVQMGQSVKLSMLQSRGNEVAGNNRNEVANNRNHALRFSFERVITANNGKQMRREAMKPLTEVEEEECENDGVDVPRQEHTAFRDLFPEEEEVGQLNRDIYSPTFKNI